MESSGVGTHYLDVCKASSGPGSEEAGSFSQGVESILAGKAEMFQLEYPCHSPTEARWFLGRVTPFRGTRPGAGISHMNITDRKLLEFQLAKLAGTDPLTSLPNRRFFIEMANREVERVQRFGAVASVIFFDLDHFKTVNDSFGHAAGDETLRTVSQACKAVLRPTDTLARFGGEEFVVILSNVGMSNAGKVAERMRRAAERAQIIGAHKPFNVTASFGVADVRLGDTSVDESLARADSALYLAKREGRNRVRIFSDMTKAASSSRIRRA